LTTLVLIAGLTFIERKQIDYHQLQLTTAFARLGGFIFLICYILLHLNPAEEFNGEGTQFDTFIFSF